MSQLLVAGGLGNAFRDSTQSAAYLKLFARQQEEERLRRERRADFESDASDTLDLALTVITAPETREFRVELDLYSTASVEALQQNEIALANVQKRLDKVFAQSYTLPDGRKVWKTVDGTEVYDERGEKLSLAVIDPAEIADELPRWETVKPMIGERDLLLKERTDILDYQGKLDDAHERLDAGDLSRKEFDAMREDLKADMPDVVRAHVPDMEAKDTPKIEAAGPQTEELDITDNMVPTQPAAKAFIPSFSG